MATRIKHDARIDVRLPAEVKSLIERAAAQRGQSMSDFVVGTLAEVARTVIERQGVTVLSERDREVFLALLDDAEARPNLALKRAAKRYRSHLGE